MDAICFRAVLEVQNILISVYDTHLRYGSVFLLFPVHKLPSTQFRIVSGDLHERQVTQVIT